MFHEIRKYIAILDGDPPIGGPFRTVEVDETYIAGQVSGKGRGYKGNKTVVLGMKQRSGDIITRVVPNRCRGSLLPHVAQHVRPFSEVHTDEHGSYDALSDVNGYRHKRVNHLAGECRTRRRFRERVEGFWAQLKRSINGTHIHVSAKHLPKYLGEFEFRHNRRHRPETMLSELMTAFQR